MRRLRLGGGWPAVWYAVRTARRSGGFFKFLRAMQSRNACKTCALGMGGQRGGMVDEAGKFPEVCKKSMQAMAADMQSGLNEQFFSSYGFDALRQFTSCDLEHMGRLVQPVYANAGETHYRPISWDKAISLAVQFLRATPPDQAFFYSSGRSSNEAAFAMQLFARLYGTNNVNNCSYYCHQASGVGLSSALGTGTSTVVLEDLEHCDLMFLIGGNPASNHPRLMRALMKLRRRGGDVIVVNPIRETGLVNFGVPSDLRSLLFGSPIASIYVQPHIGGDIALLSGVAKSIEESSLIDERFLSNCTDGAPEFRQHLRRLSWKEIEAASGVTRETIERVADRYAASERSIFAWTMGVTHHLHGVDNVRAIVNLALLRGMVGKRGAGLLPIRGHSNVQGVGSMGVSPKLQAAIFQRLEKHYGVRLPTTPGLDTLSCIDAMHMGKLRTGWCLGGNLFGANPDARRTKDAFNKLDSLVYFSTTLNTGHVHGRAAQTLILPMLARDEEQQPTTQESMFNYVRLSEGGPRRHDGPRGEVEAVATIARGVLGDGGPVDWGSMQEHRAIRQAIGAIVPGYEQISAIDDTRREFQVAGRTYHQPRFHTPSGRAKFHVLALPVNPPLSPLSKGGGDPPPLGKGGGDTTPLGRGGGDATPLGKGGGYAPLLGKGESDAPLLGKEGVGGGLRLMTIRSEGQFNTVVYEEQDIYRHQERRDVILLNSADIQRLGLRIDQRVTVRSSAGEMRNILVREWDIRAGNAAMYYPEANVLVPAEADRESRTPAFKSVAITMHPEPTTVSLTVPRVVIPATASVPASRMHAC